MPEGNVRPIVTSGREASCGNLHMQMDNSKARCFHKLLILTGEMKEKQKKNTYDEKSSSCERLGLDMISATTSSCRLANDKCK